MSTNLDTLNAVPKYHQLVSILRRKIEDGDWPPHTPIPPERELEQLYHISRTTIRMAIGILIRHGYLYREQGRGTFVQPSKLQKNIPELTSFSEEMKKRGMVPGQKILNMGPIIAPAKVIEKLEIMSDEEAVLFIQRLRLADDKPIGLHTSYLVLPPGEIIDRNELEQAGSLYSILREKYNIIPTEAEEALEATLSSSKEAALLQTTAGSPLLLNTRTMFAQNHRPVEYSKILFRGDRYQYIYWLTR
jgi:GntR family transcriptional regulator